MKKYFLLSMLLLLAATTLSAQTILKGDMNNDNEVTIADVTSVVNVVLGKAPKETINAGGSPYLVDNSLVVGTWYAPDGTSFTLNEDGTTNFPNAATFKFRPYQGTLMLFNASGRPLKTLVLNEVETSYLLAIDYATGAYTYYINSGSLATGITLSQTSLSIYSDNTAQLSASLSPEGAVGNVTWTSSNESVATVDANGVVTAIEGGNCTITATVGGSGVKATCIVT
ncbi:MAG: Ig-like domain-containing protein, partial [Bacteroidales bacterium]|nr:Ig-like domain-containing protein [Bacteroidales bacterium]